MSALHAVVPALLVVALPGAAAAQCAIDLVESGIESYRDLELDEAEELLRDAVVSNSRASSPCATESARALTYLGAIHWLSENPDSAAESFARAVVQAPRFRPDGFEFPPDITEAFDRVRAATPSVAVTLPDLIEIGPRGSSSLSALLTASTQHQVTVSVRGPSEAPVRVLYRGPVQAEGRGTFVEWDGRDANGDFVPSGDYTFDVVSLDRESQPLRTVVIALSVESDAPERTVPLETSSFVRPNSGGGGGNVWKAIAVGGVGLVGGALIAGIPPVIDGLPQSDARYVVAGSVSLAGIIGFFQQLRGDGTEPAPVVPVRAAERAEEVVAPTLRIRPGYERRIELAFDPAQDHVRYWDNLLGR